MLQRFIYPLSSAYRVLVTAASLVAIIAALAPCAGAAEAPPELALESSRSSMFIGESFTLRVRVRNIRRPPEPDISGITGAKISSLGSHDSSSRTIIVRNRRSEVTERLERVFDYKITPETAGLFVAGPVRLALPGGTLIAQGPTIRVTDVHRQDIVKISVEASRDTVLPDESFDVTLLVRIRALKPPYAEYEPLFPKQPPRLNVPFLNPDVQPGLQRENLVAALDKLIASPSAPGLAINRYELRRSIFDSFFGMDPFGDSEPTRFALPHRNVSTNGREYVEYFLSTKYDALEEGTYTFGPVELKGVVPVNHETNGEPGGEEVFAVGPACTVRVVPPPEQGRPETYVGTFGSSLSLEASLDTASCRVGDPIILALALWGDVRLDKVMPPKLSLQPGIAGRFDVYDDTVQSERDDGRLLLKYTLRPRLTGDLTVPHLAVSYFDTNERQYKTSRTDPLSLFVEASEDVTAEHVVGGSTNAAAAFERPTDVRALEPAHVWRVTGDEPAPPLWGGRPVAFMLFVGPAFFALVAMLKAHAAGRHERRARRRQRRALPRALALIRKAAQTWEQDAGAACAALSEALRAFLAERLNMVAAGATPEDIRRLLAEAGLPEKESDVFSSAYANFFNTTFAGAGMQAAPCDFAGLTATLKALNRAPLATAQKTATQGRLLPALAFVLLLGASLAACMAPDARPGPDTGRELGFLLQEGNARMTAAGMPEDFRAAAEIYAKAASLGADGAALFYNLGTAWLKAGNPAEAIAAFERAELRGGAHPDLTRNLEIAMARRADFAYSVMPWQRAVFFWHYRLACPLRAKIAALAYTLCWLAASLRLLRPRMRGLGPVLVIAALVLAAAGSSAAFSLHKDAVAASRPLPAPAPADTLCKNR